MYTYLKNIEKRLNSDQKDILEHIYEPTVVATPLSDSRATVCILPDGEIRSYGRIYCKNHGAYDGKVAYLSSVDGGLSWNIKYSHGKMNACTYLEKADIYITIVDSTTPTGDGKQGLYVYRSKQGPDDPNPEIICLSTERYIDSFLPQQSFYTDRIWFTAQCNGVPWFYFSDDFGVTWGERQLQDSKSFEPIFPNKGMSWCKGSGSEPYAVELSQDKMMMLIRTPRDCFYKSYSSDGGNTWSEPEPTTFYGTNTTSFMLRLQSGRIVTFWNNTRPLSLPNHNATVPPVAQCVKDGTGESAFTNRDAAHVAVSDDGGESWTGYRELLLNPIRNNSDFRYYGGVVSSLDKSVHQFQAFELPFNKILVSVGQNVASRRLVIFDINWLYENVRKEDFLSGLSGITTHTYLKSVSGCRVWEVGNGHCSWNRTHGAYPVPNPDGSSSEVLYIPKLQNNDIINGIGGAVWNFPASQKGRVTVEIKIVDKQARFVLTDRWYNTCDPYASIQSPFWFELDATDVGNDFAKISIDFNTQTREAEVFINENRFFKVKMTQDCPTGVSYLILQCAADGDCGGFYVKSLEKTTYV